MKLPTEYVYCIDTSALIDLQRRFYPPDVFKSLWKNFENLIVERRIISPREVLNELKNTDDELFNWAKTKKKMFIDLDLEQMKLLKDILSTFSNLIDPNKIIPDADPFIIALAISEGCSVISSENLTGSGGRPKIPNVCQHFNITCFKLIDFFRRQNWTF